MKIGDKVVKARPSSTGKWCEHGGTEEQFPIGTIGIIKAINDEYGDIVVDFTKDLKSGKKLHNSWRVHVSEIDIIDPDNILEIELDNKIYKVLILEVKDKE